MTRRISVVSRQSSVVSSRQTRGGFTLVEMLIAMAITLVMIGAVVTLFANISNSVRNRRAVIEMSGQLRHARNMLQKDLQGATCNGLVWQRPDENQGYIEIIEGARREGQASVLVDGVNQPDPTMANYNPEIDHKTSIIPASNVPFADATWLTDGGSLGDYDDILMLTVRNEHEPFVGRVPKTDGTASAVRQVGNNSARPFPNWEPTTIESPLAEVVWFAVENPEEDADADGFFGEPGMRTIYRRALLIAPWHNPYRTTDNTGTVDDTFQLAGDPGSYTAQPGLVRVLKDDVARNDVAEAIASLIAFQERYDLSVRLEFDPLLGDSNGRWKIVANTLGDLTKRENRYGHLGYGYDNSVTPASYTRLYPYPMASIGVGQSAANLAIEQDPELTALGSGATIRGNANANNNIVLYQVTAGGSDYPVPPFVHFTDNVRYPATARAMLNDDGAIVRVIHGPVPLSRERRGEDVMLTDALGFDLRVYDPGVPLFAHTLTETILEPSDPAWLGQPPSFVGAYMHANNMGSPNGVGNGSSEFPFVGQGAYVDLGYGFDSRGADFAPPRALQLPEPRFAAAYSSSTKPWFFTARALSDVFGNQLAPGYTVFDTWSFHYENNGLDEDVIHGADQGTNGLDEIDFRSAGAVNLLDAGDFAVSGPDDVGERETAPPYDKPLRGVQVLLRLYERDSRQVRQVSVNQSFVPE